MKPGIYYNVPQEQYFALQAANNSGLVAIQRSPLHYWSKFLDPEREPYKVSPSLHLGSAIHCAILEPERFEKEYRKEPLPTDYQGALVTLDDYKNKCEYLGLKKSGVKDEVRARIKEASPNEIFFDEILDQFSKFKLLNKAQWRAANTIARNVRNSVAAQVMLGDGAAEVMMVWNDPETGVLCKARADWLTKDGSIIIDFKSSKNASPEEFWKSYIDYKYYRQAAWYLEGAEVLFGKSEERLFIFPVYETEPPYASAVYESKRHMLDEGRKENRFLLKKYAECLSKNEWPGYPDTIIPVNVPAWWKSKITTEETETMETY